MGSISSVCTKKRIIDVTSQRIFTEEEVIVLRRQWPVMMTNVDQNAVNLFMNLFTINRNLMTKFDFAAGYYFDAEKTLNDARLVYHVRRVYQLVDMIIGALDDQSKYNEAMKMIEKIGEVHMKYKIHTVDFEDFTEAFLMNLAEVLRGTFDEKSKTIWRKLIAEIVFHVGSYNRNDELSRSSLNGKR